MTKIIIFIVLVTNVIFAEDFLIPTWLLTIPTANTLPRDICNAGIFYLDLGITPDLEIGLHGIKYGISYSDSSKLAFGASLLVGLYPYAVYTKNYDFGELSIGINPFPYFIFAGLKSKIDNNMLLIAEIHNGAAVGVRNKLTDDWTLDLGGGLTTYPYKNYFFYDYANTDYFYFKFPTSLSPFLVLTLFYTFNINPPALPEVVPEGKPVEPGERPIDPIK